MSRFIVGAATLLLTVASTAEAQLGRQRDRLVEPNIAADSTLLALPYLTPTVVEAIKAARPILSVVTLDSILTAQRLTKPQRDSLYRRMFVHVDLNRGTDAEFLLIPGAGPRMLREFKEYRPWTSYAQFEREIGKYVRRNPTEVARLWRYAIIR